MQNFKNYSNNIHRGFSPYGSKSSTVDKLKEKQEALAFAKKLQEKHISDLKKLNSYKESQKELQNQKELDKKIDEQNKVRLEKIKNLSNTEIQKSVEIAKIQNEKFKNKFAEDSSLDDLFNTLSDDLKNY